MAASNRSSEAPSDDPQYTDVKITNSSGQTVVKDAVIIWKGSLPPNIPDEISSGQSGEFKHEQDAVVGLEFKLEKDKYTLIVAWSKEGDSNKVNAAILDADNAVDCDQIKKNLVQSGKYSAKHFEFECLVEIDSKNGRPTVRLKIMMATKEALPSDEG